MTIGENIRIHRKRAGLTQKKLGEISGTSETTIKQYELGKRQPRIDQLIKIANALNTSTINLVGDQQTGLIDMQKKVYPPKLYSLALKLEEIGYLMDGSQDDSTDSDSYNNMFIYLPDGVLLVPDADLIELNEEVKSYLKFKLEEYKKKFPIISYQTDPNLGQESVTSCTKKIVSAHGQLDAAEKAEIIKMLLNDTDS